MQGINTMGFISPWENSLDMIAFHPEKIISRDEPNGPMLLLGRIY